LTTSKKLALPIILVLAAGAAAVYVIRLGAAPLVLTGIVTTHDVVVSSQLAGQVERLLVDDGAAVSEGQLLAVIVPDELKADTTYYNRTAEGLGAQVDEAAAAVRFQAEQLDNQVRQAEATLQSVQSQEAAARADLENARLNLERTRKLTTEGVATAQQLDEARTTLDSNAAKVESLVRQAEAQRAAIALAKSNREQVTLRQSQLRATERQRDAAVAQTAKAEVRLGYTEIHAPVAGLVDVRAVRTGEVVTQGQALLTLVNPDDLWVRVDVEETYIDRVRLGDRLTVRLPSGAERQGVVIYRGVDAAFATQRDVSRTKRDIKTFEVRLRVDNADRRLAVGMTAYVLLPVAP
jgi:HlyD family secretion protein